MLQLAKGSEALEEAALKRARREKMLLVHPDKTGHVPGGNEAFDAVNIVRPTLENLGFWGSHAVNTMRHTSLLYHDI